MFTWTGINYSATNAAMDAAKTGKVTTQISESAFKDLKQWIPGAQDLETTVSHDLEGPPREPNKIIFWTPNVGSVPWKNDITVAIVYPYEIDSPLLSLLGKPFRSGM